MEYRLYFEYEFSLRFQSFQDMYNLKCGHKFCRGCWGHYLTQKIVEEGMSKSIACVEPNCEIEVDDEDVFMVIDDPDVLNKYRRSMTEDFVAVRQILDPFRFALK